MKNTEVSGYLYEFFSYVISLPAFQININRQADPGIFAEEYPKFLMGFPNTANTFSNQKSESYEDTQ